MDEHDGTIPPPDDATASVTALHERRGVGARAVLVLAIVLALAAAGTVYALRAASGGPPLDSLVPSTTAMYVEVALDPPSSQRDALGGLLDRLPAEDRAKVGSAIDDALDGAFGSVGLSFSEDVKPWVGGRAAVAVTSLDITTFMGSPPQFVALLHVRDERAARAALQRAMAGRGAFDVADGVAYVAASSDAIARLRAAVTGGTSLAEQADYATVRAGLGEDGLAWLWTSGAAGITGGVAPGGPAQMPQGPAGAVLRATADGIELVGNGSGAPATTNGRRPALLEGTGPGLLASLTWIDPGTTLTTFLQSFEEIGPLLGGGGSPIEEVEDYAGFDLVEDVVPWLHGEVSVVLGGFTTPPIPDAGILIEPTDERALTRTMRAIGERLRRLGRDLGGTLRRDAGGFSFEGDGFGAVVRRAPGRLVLATSEAYAQQLLAGSSPSLGDDAVYRRAVGDDTEGTVFQVYVRLDRIESLLSLALPAEARAQFEEGPAAFFSLFESFSITARTTAEGSSFRMALTTAA